MKTQINIAQLASLLTAARALGITSNSKLRAMLFLMDQHQTTMNSLATHLGISTAAVTGLVDDLAALAFVRRAYDTADRRKIFLSITLTGRVMLERLLDPELTPA